MTIGFIGLGQMGLPMVALLAAAGNTVLVYDLDAAAVAQAEAAGARRADSRVALGQACDTIVTMLPTSAIVMAVMLGDEGVAQALKPGSLVIDMGSSRPEDTRSLGETLAGMGHAMVDAPVSGGVSRAKIGDLAIMAGGDEAAVARAQAIVAPLARSFIHVGPLGAGHAVKALNNLLSAIGLMGAAEVLLVAERFGLDKQRVLDVLNGSTGRNNSTETKIAQFVLSGSFASGFGLGLLRKDVGIAQDLIRSTDARAPLSDRAIAMIGAAADALPGDADHTRLAEWIDDQAGL